MEFKKYYFVGFIIAILLIFSNSLNSYSQEVLHDGTGYVKENIVTKDIPATIPFHDNFEDGDISDYNNLGGASAEASNTVAANGTYSVHISGGSFGTGLSRTFENGTL